MGRTPDVVIAGGGIADSALAAVLARGNVQVAVLEHDLESVDRVSGAQVGGRMNGIELPYSEHEVVRG